MGSPNETRELRTCKTCGKRLIRQYYWMGLCSKCSRLKNSEVSLDRCASEAKAAGLSYGQYMALKKED